MKVVSPWTQDVSWTSYVRSIYVLCPVDFFRSSLIYNTSAKDERHEYNTSETRATQVRHEYYTHDMSATRTTRLRHEWKIFDFDNCTSKYIFSDSYIYYMAVEILQREEQFHSKYYLWKYLIPMPKCVWKVHHKNWSL